MYKTISKQPQESPKHSEGRTYYQQSKKDVNIEVNVTRINKLHQKEYMRTAR